MANHNCKCGDNCTCDPCNCDKIEESDNIPPVTVIGHKGGFTGGWAHWDLSGHGDNGWQGVPYAYPPEKPEKPKKKFNCHGFKGFGTDNDRHIRESAQKNGVDEKALRGFVKKENGWTGKDSYTGAVGVGQFTEATWNGLIDKHGGGKLGMVKVGAANKGKANDPRRDNRINTLATGLLMKVNGEKLDKAGVEKTPENLYLVHNIGPGVIPALKGQKVGEPALKSMRTNGMKKGETVAQFLKRQGDSFLEHYDIANHDDCR